MNRRQRRATARSSSARRIRALEAKVQSTGQPGVIYGLTDACRDCTADGALVLLPGGDAIGHVYHDDHCPAAGHHRLAALPARRRRRGMASRSARHDAYVYLVAMTRKTFSAKSIHNE